VTPSFLATYLAATFDAAQGGHVVSAACTSALVALAQAHDLVARGEEEAVLVGAIEEDCPSTFWAFDKQRQLTYASSAEERTRPLSGRLGGFVPAGGAGFFVLESEAHATGRGAKVLGRVPRVATRSSRPAGASVLAFPKVAYEAALRDALVAGPVDLVLAHAPPTLADTDELAVIVGLTDAAVRSYKSVFGYTVGASAALDLALALAFLDRGHAPPNDLGEDAPSARVHGGALVAPVTRVRRVAKLAYAQGFSAGSLVVEAP
jgi:3-oxoacyl-(acyl-carrier-protein) synthase